MKTTFSTARRTLCHLAASAAVLALALPLAVGAAEPIKGGQQLLHLQGLKTQAEAEALKTGDTVAMVCTKCQTVMIHRVTTEKGHIQMLTGGQKHLCTGCNSTIEVVGHGKAKTDVVKHTCNACGDDSVFCCATKPGAGATKGMEKK